MGCPNGHAMLFWFFEVIRFSKEVGIGFQDTEVQLSALCSCILVDWDSTKACTKGTLFFGEKYPPFGSAFATLTLKARKNYAALNRSCSLLGRASRWMQGWAATFGVEERLLVYYFNEHSSLRSWHTATPRTACSLAES